jgi:hypothetical protein
MIPESYVADEIALYQARNFPYDWEKRSVLKKGEKPVFEDYIKEVTVNGVLLKNYGLLISTNFDSEQEGTYNVHYYISTDDGYEGHSILTVVVE